jgi:hypothetical protein
MEAGLKREVLGHQVGKSYHSIVAYELGKAFPPANVVGDLAVALGCSANDLFVDEPVPKPAA